MAGRAIKSVNTVQPKILKFRPCGKDRHRLCVLKVHGIKVLSMKAGGEKGQNNFPREHFQYQSCRDGVGSASAQYYNILCINHMTTSMELYNPFPHHPD